MRTDRFEYFATEADHERFFSKIDKTFGLKVVETGFDRKAGPRVFEGLVDFLDFIRRDADPIERKCIYYCCAEPRKLRPTENIYSDHLASFNLIDNPDVLTFNYGEKIDQDRLVISILGRSQESIEAKKLLSRIKRMAKALGSDASATLTGDFVFPGALSFVTEGGRLVRTPDAPPIYDARIAG